MENEDGYDSSTQRNEADITAVHAAAVTGDKSTLTKLIYCMYI